MTLSELIKKLESQGILLALQNDQIVALTKPSLLTQELKTEISRLKAELKVFLKANSRNLQILKRLFEEYQAEFLYLLKNPALQTPERIGSLKSRFEVPLRKLWDVLSIQEKHEFLGPEFVYKTPKVNKTGFDPEVPLKCHSKLLNEDFVIYPLEKRVCFQSGVIYTEREFAELKKLSPEEIKWIHKAKQILPGEIVNVGEADGFEELQRQVKKIIKDKQPVEKMKQ